MWLEMHASPYTASLASEEVNIFMLTKRGQLAVYIASKELLCWITKGQSSPASLPTAPSHINASGKVSSGACGQQPPLSFILSILDSSDLEDILLYFYIIMWTLYCVC